MKNKNLERYNTRWETEGSLRKLALIAMVGLASVGAGLFLDTNPRSISLIAGVLFLLIFLPLSFWHLEKLFYLWIFVVPLLPWYLGSSIFADRYLINIQRLLMFILVAALLFRTDILKKSFALPLKGILAACLLTYMLSTIFSLLPLESLARLFTEVWLGSYLIFYLAYNIVQIENDAERVYAIVLYGAGIISIITIVTTITGTDYQRLFSFWVPFTNLFSVETVIGRGYRFGVALMRNQASLAHPMELGNYLVFLLPLAWGRMLFARDKWKYRFLVLLMLCAIIFSGERAPLLFAALLIALLSLIGRRGALTGLVMIVGLVLAAWIIFVRSGVYWSVDSTNPFSLSVFLQYISNYSNIGILISHNPLLGMGPGVSSIIFGGRNLQSTINSIGGVAITSWDAPILLKFQEIGFLGSFSWIGFLISCGYIIWRRGIKDLRNINEVGMDQIAIAIALAMSLLDNSFQAGVFAWPQSTMIVMALLGVTVKLSRIRARETLL